MSNLKQFMPFFWALSGAAALIGIIGMSISGEISRDRDVKARESEILEKGYFRIKTFEGYPRPSDIDSRCGSVEHLVTNTGFFEVNKNDIANGYILFCKDNIIRRITT